MSTNWVFDRPPDSGSKTGGITAEHIFSGKIDAFVREVLQNSRDQAATSEAVGVAFSLHELSGEHKESFLGSIGWERLREHLQGVTREQGAFARQMEAQLGEIEDQPLRLLRIDDWNTKGLTGDEAGRDGNFAALCRHLLVSSEAAGERGGSYGLGKAVLGAFSGLSLVLFSSRLEQGGAERFRFIGKVELPYHEAEGSGWRGPGWFGEEKELASGGTRAESLWDGAAVEAATPLQLARPKEMGTGTSILIVAFNEPDEEGRRELKLIARELAESAVRWFWPALFMDSPSLSVEVSAFRNGQEVVHLVAEPTEEVQPFIDLVRAENSGPHATEPEEVGEEEIEVVIPERTYQPVHLDTAVNSRLRVTRGESSMNAREFANRIALFRGAGMVVKYHKPRDPTLDELPFFGVLQVGRASGAVEIHGIAERFFRAAEPPAHDNWILTKSLKGEYKRGSGSTLDGMFRSIDKALARICRSQAPKGTEGPQLLAKLLRLGAKGGGTVAKGAFTTSALEARLREEAWEFSGRVRRLEGGAGEEWSVVLDAWLAGETGKGIRIPITSLALENRDLQVRSRRNGSKVIAVPGWVDEVDFAGSTIRVSEVENAPAASRTRLSLDVLPAKGATHGD